MLGNTIFNVTKNFIEYKLTFLVNVSEIRNYILLSLAYDSEQ